jgi:UDP-N-acetylmuramate dehydrogenase
LLQAEYDTGKLTTFKIGGKIKEVYFPASVEEFCASEFNDVKVFGNLSNTLVSSYGYSGAVVLTSKMDEIRIEDTKIYADCGVKGPVLAQQAAKLGLSGLEFMAGFPGSVGGEVYMNASANGQSVSSVIVNIILYSKDRGAFTLKKSEMEFGYRSSVCQRGGYAVLGAEFELERRPAEEIKAKMQENLAFRKSRQPGLALPNAGSVFRNPQGDFAGRLLEDAGVKGLKYGGAKVWENHSNFILNENQASSTDVLELMLLMYNRVKEKSGIELEPEIVFLGGNNAREIEIWETLTKTQK